MTGCYCLSKKSHVSHHIDFITAYAGMPKSKNLHLQPWAQSCRRWWHSPIAYSIIVWLRVAHLLLMHHFSRRRPRSWY